MKVKMETAVCIGCGKPFERRSGRSNPTRFCPSVKCQKIKNIKNSVARFDTLPSPRMSIYRADIQYHGKPNI